LKTFLAAVLAAVLMTGPLMAADDPKADLSAADYDAKMRDFDTQIRNIQNTPVDFCDPAAVDAQSLAWLTVYARKRDLRDQREKKHPAFQQAARAVADSMADEGTAADEVPLLVVDYEAAMKRGDTKAANALMNKMMPWEQESAAESQRDHALTFRILTPMADQGDIKAQRRLAILYSWETNFNQATITHAVPPVPRDDALAFKYARMASLSGDEIAQELLAKAYACGLGTQRDLVKAYAWFSLAMSQSALMLKADNGPEEILRRRDFIAAQMSHDDMQRAKRLLIQCHKSEYKNCEAP